MAVSQNIAQIISMYWEADRSAVQKRYESLFPADTDARQADTPDTDGTLPAEEAMPKEEPDPFDDKVLESELLNEIAPLRLSPELAESVKEVWHDLYPHWKVVAIHYLSCAGTDRWSIPHQLEGLLACFEGEIATHIMHRWFPEKVFPLPGSAVYGRPSNQAYGQIYFDDLRAIFRLLGVQCKEDGNRLPVDILLDIGEAVESYRLRQKLEPWQTWALVYDLGPRLLPPPAPYPTEEPPHVWMVASNNTYRSDFDGIDGINAAEVHEWAGNRKARRGDLALMYNLAPRSAIVAVFRCADDAYQNPFGGWTGYRVRITDKIAIPWLTFKEMKADPILRDWNLIKLCFTGCLKYEVPSKIWARLRELIRAKDAKIGSDLDQYVVATSGVRMIVEDGLSEEEFENRTVVPLLEKLGWDMARTVRRQHEMDVKVGSGRPKRVRADFVGYRDALGSESLLVIESKRHVRSDSELAIAVEQCESYAGKLRCARFAVAAPEGFWVFDLRFPGQSEQRAFVAVNMARVDETIKKLEPLIGYISLRDAQRQ